MDFTFVCPTEIAEFGRRERGLRRPRRAGPRRQHRHALRAPRLAQGPPGPARPAVPDARRHQARAVARRSASCTSRTASPLRATFIVDPEGVIRYVERQRPHASAATWTRCCACSTRCRPTSSARATGRRASRPWRSRDRGGPRRRSASGCPRPPRTSSSTCSRCCSDGALSAAQRWGVAIASAIAARNPALREAVLAERAAEAGRRGGRRRPRGGGAHGDEQRLLPVPPHGRQADLREKPARLRMNRLAKPATNKAGLRAVLPGGQRHQRLRDLHPRAREGACIEGGLTEDQVHDAVRIAATVNAAAVASRWPTFRFLLPSDLIHRRGRRERRGGCSSASSAISAVRVAPDPLGGEEGGGGGGRGRERGRGGGGVRRVEVARGFGAGGADP